MNDSLPSARLILHESVTRPFLALQLHQSASINSMGAAQLTSVLVLCALCVIGSVSATLGVDISQPLDGSTATCLKNAGYDKMIARGYKSSGSVDGAMCGSMKAAQNAGMQVGVYLFPCPTCGDPSGQVQSVANALRDCGIYDSTIWLDIEGQQYWLGNSNSNRSFYTGLVDACNSSGYSCGVYSSYYQWQNVMGTTDYSYGSDLPLWYAHYDDSPDMGDFQAFGGWYSASMKQYQGDQTVCNFGVDLDYFE